MNTKYLMLFVSISIIVLMSLNAVAEDVIPVHTEASVVTSDSETQQCKNQLYTVQSSETPCNKEKAPAQKPEKVTEPTLNSTSKDKVNLSFNFIYYILYKFKYIDIFELLRP